MFTNLQRSLLRITGLICAGFILGIAAKSPSVNPLLDPIPVEASPVAAQSEGETVLPAQSAQTEQRMAGDSTIDCSDLNSARCRDLRDSYQRYLKGDWDWNSSYGPVKPAPVQIEAAAEERRPSPKSSAPNNGELRVVTVFHGSEAKEFLVRRETN